MEAQAEAKRPLIASLRALPSLPALRGEIAAEADRWGLWSPVALGMGCALYITAMREPSWAFLLVAAGVVAAACVGARLWGRSRALIALTTLLALCACGAVLSKTRAVRVAAPVAPVLQAVTIEGWVVEVASPSESGPRLVIAPTYIEGLSPDATPLRVRVTSPDGIVGPGAAVRFTGLLNPPPPPAAPGAYDFARNAWFDGIGGVGVALTPPQIITLPEPPPRLKLRLIINALRWSLAQRISERMSPTAGGLGAAMVTGNEAFIAQDTEDDLRDAGLAHIISISGLHMAIVGGFVFFAVRLGLAAWPWLALRVPGKKIAAACGLVAISVYLVVSGAPAPAVRAAVTAGVAIGAILFDRRAISLHALAVAAFIVLILQPEAVVEPGFQMSFAATAALVALVEAWPPKVREINTPWPFRVVQNAGLWVVLSMAASLVAGLATGPFAIQHFNRVAVYGLPANLITEPLSVFVIMPALALGGVLETIGLGGPFLWIASLGIDAMNALAGAFANAPGAVLTIPSAPGFVLAIALLGILWLCLWRGRLRWLGLPAAFAVALWPRPEAPAAWIANDGSTAVVREGKTAVFMRPGEKLFGAELWSGRRGLTQGPDPAADRDRRFECTGQSCRSKGAAALRLSVWWTARRPKAEDLEALCRASDVLALKAPVEVPAACRGVVVLRAEDFARNGAVEIYPEGKGWRLVWAQPLRGERPWTGRS